MEEQRQPFRFRLPWLAQPPRSNGPMVENPRTPLQSTTSIPIRRPSTKPEPSTTKPISQSDSSQTKASNNNNNKPPLPSFVAIETPDADSQSTSSKSVAVSRLLPPSRSANESPKTTQPTPTKSPSPVRPQSKVASPTLSPSKGDSKSKTSISPLTPSRRLAPQKTTTKTAPNEAKTTVTIASQPRNRGSSEPNPPSSRPQVPSQESELKVEIKSEAAKKVISPTQRPNSEAQESPEEEKSNKADYEEVTRQNPIAEKPGSGNNETEAKIQQNRENFSERKETLSTTSYIGKQIKTVSPSKPAFRSSVDEEEAPRQREIEEDISKLVRNLTTGPQSEGKHVVVVTLTGENSGASLVLSSEQAEREASIHIHRGYKADPDDSHGSTTDGKEPTKRKKLSDKANTTPAALAYVNSNVQSINNSIVVEASVPGRNPGVHLVFSQKTSPGAPKVKEHKSKLVNTRKAEFTSTRAERLTHEPNVRRRCLRGLFLESSDSEPDNPNKPRRHGCRYSCGEMSKDKELM